MEESKKDRNLEVATFSMGFLAERKPRSGFVFELLYIFIMHPTHVYLAAMSHVVQISGVFLLVFSLIFFFLFSFLKQFGWLWSDWVFVTLIDYLWGWFWTPQRLFTQVSGVHRATAGYTGGRSAKPTYRSVCNGDGCLDLMIWDLWFERWALQQVLNKRLKCYEMLKQWMAWWFACMCMGLRTCRVSTNWIRPVYCFLRGDFAPRGRCRNSSNHPALCLGAHIRTPHIWYFIEILKYLYLHMCIHIIFDLRYQVHRSGGDYLHSNDFQGFSKEGTVCTQI